MRTNMQYNILAFILTLITIISFLLVIITTIYLALTYQAYFFVVVGLGLMYLGYNGKWFKVDFWV